MKKRRAKALPILLIVIVVAAAGAWFALSGKQDKVDYITETARVADIRKVVNATGEVGAVSWSAWAPRLRAKSKNFT